MAKRGAPRKPDYLKKRPICLKLPGWLLERIDAQPGSRSVFIENLCIEKFGWTPDDQNIDSLIPGNQKKVYTQTDLPGAGLYHDKQYWIERLENVDDMNKYKGIRFSMPSDIFHELIDLLESTFIRLGGDDLIEKEY